MKDLNYLERERKIRLGPEKRKLFVEQIEKDAQFLADHNIMDYSLLLGIHDMTRGNSEDIRLRSLSVFEVRLCTLEMHGLIPRCSTRPPQPHLNTGGLQQDAVSKTQRKALKKAIAGDRAVALEDTDTKLSEHVPGECAILVFVLRTRCSSLPRSQAHELHLLPG